jgi:hypothetical protein
MFTRFFCPPEIPLTAGEPVEQRRGGGRGKWLGEEWKGQFGIILCLPTMECLIKDSPKSSMVW